MQLTVAADTVSAASDDCWKCRPAEALQVPVGYVFMNSAVQAT